MRESKAMRAAPRLAPIGLAVALLGLTASEARAAVELSDQYFRLIEAELPMIEQRLVTDPGADPKVLEAQGRLLPGALMAAAVLYAKPHPANRSHGDRRMLALAWTLGDLLTVESAQGR